MDNKSLMNKWRNFFGIGVIISAIDFFAMINQEDASTGAKITAVILLIGIVFCIVCIAKVNTYNAKIKNMSADEYISDRFANAIPETKKVSGITIKCPYCQSTNTKKISNVSKAGSVAVFGVLAAGKVSKQWHCNNCKSDF
ncbi:MAG: hypothetical protein NC489_29695 [Ruminococcus flavefaciens]|nr:hypothetical protein [Ruminococcus flavefaciens]